MAKRKARNEIPIDLAARVLFKADRICCICRAAGKPVQIHHIDDDPSNSVERNLAVLCFDCHTDTQVRGGFHRKLDANQVILYRDDWAQMVERRRAVIDASVFSGTKENSEELKLLTTNLDLLKEHEQYWQLAIEYDSLGNPELRDKYVELALQGQHDDDTLIFLRSMQGRSDLIPVDTIEREIRRRKKSLDWSNLGRLYTKIGDHKNGALNYCRTITESLRKGNVFGAAFYLKELSETGLHGSLFEAAYRKATAEGDLWWRIRALQELGWLAELREVVLDHEREIEESGDSLMLEVLYRTTGQLDKLQAERRKLAETDSLLSDAPRRRPKKRAKKKTSSPRRPPNPR